jgi:hypothetical protein
MLSSLARAMAFVRLSTWSLPYHGKRGRAV